MIPQGYLNTNCPELSNVGPSSSTSKIAHFICHQRWYGEPGVKEGQQLPKLCKMFMAEQHNPSQTVKFTFYSHCSQSYRILQHNFRVTRYPHKYKLILIRFRAAQVSSVYFKDKLGIIFYVPKLLNLIKNIVRPRKYVQIQCIVDWLFYHRCFGLYFCRLSWIQNNACLFINPIYNQYLYFELIIQRCFEDNLLQDP